MVIFVTSKFALLILVGFRLKMLRPLNDPWSPSAAWLWKALSVFSCTVPSPNGFPLGWKFFHTRSETQENCNGWLVTFHTSICKKLVKLSQSGTSDQRELWIKWPKMAHFSAIPSCRSPLVSQYPGEPRTPGARLAGCTDRTKTPTDFCSGKIQTVTRGAKRETTSVLSIGAWSFFPYIAFHYPFAEIRKPHPSDVKLVPFRWENWVLSVQGKWVGTINELRLHIRDRTT